MTIIASSRRWLVYAGMFLMGIVLGGAAGRYLYSAASSDISFAEYFARLLGILISLYVVYFIHTAAHEAGHLLLGRLTGYGFVSYRIGSFMIRKEAGKLRPARMTVAGTGGQCLLSPPPRREDGSFPYVAYNVGGVTLNLILAAIFLAAAIVIGTDRFFGAVSLCGTIIGVGMALINALPFMGIDNDGKNTLVLLRSEKARDAFYNQLEIVAGMAEGKRLRDLPDRVFGQDDGEKPDFSSGITAAVPIFRAERELDRGNFHAALEMLERAVSDGLPDGAQKGTAVCDIIFCRLLEGRDISDVLDAKQKNYMKMTRTAPQTLRTEYAIARLSERDDKKAEEIKKRLSAALAAHPYAGEADGEREIIALIDEKADMVREK